MVDLRQLLGDVVIIGCMNEKRYRPPALNRDHARPRNTLAPSCEAIEASLTELISPASYALTATYHNLGLRWRILNLPVMVALVLTMIWRQVPSVSTLAHTLSRETLLWVAPRKVSQQALSERLRSLPSELFETVFLAILPQLHARAVARKRPQPASVERAQCHFQRLWILDATTLEAVFCKVKSLRGMTEAPLGGKLMALLDLPSKLPVRLWLDENPAANEKSFLDDRVKPLLKAGTLLLFDRGFYAFPLFDWLTNNSISFVTRARSVATFGIVQTLTETQFLRDRIISLGVYRSNPCEHPVRLVEACIGGIWHSYLTNVLDPNILSPADVIDLYGRRWRIEESFLIVKRLLGLAYLWTGAFNGIAMQIWATWLLYAVLIDLSDAVAEELNLPLDRISVEMVYRSLYYFAGAYHRGEASDPVAYLAAATDLGIVKRRRKHRERAREGKIPSELKL